MSPAKLAAKNLVPSAEAATEYQSRMGGPRLVQFVPKLSDVKTTLSPEVTATISDAWDEHAKESQPLIPALFEVQAPPLTEPKLGAWKPCAHATNLRPSEEQATACQLVRGTLFETHVFPKSLDV